MVKTSNCCNSIFKENHTTYLETQIASKTLSFKNYLGKGGESFEHKYGQIIQQITLVATNWQF